MRPFYNDQWNYELSSDAGMDNRLMERAREQEKEIRDVESALSQISMLYGFSDGVQEMLLASVLSSTPVEDMTQTNELYELWCAGDEEALFDYLYGEDESESDGSEDDESEPAESEGEESESAESESDESGSADEEMTEEEKLLYEEYEKAMETDRNAAMLEVAKGYLESGDVVFYAVGLAHLIAEDGLVNTLRDAGYTVELVPYS